MQYCNAKPILTHKITALTINFSQILKKCYYAILAATEFTYLYDKIYNFENL